MNGPPLLCCLRNSPLCHAVPSTGTASIGCEPPLHAEPGDALPAQGIVSIPGMMTGQILGGSDPAQVRRAAPHSSLKPS